MVKFHSNWYLVFVNWTGGATSTTRTSSRCDRLMPSHCHVQQPQLSYDMVLWTIWSQMLDWILPISKGETESPWVTGAYSRNPRHVVVIPVLALCHGKQRCGSSCRTGTGREMEADQVNSLGSEGEDEVGVWSLEPQECSESLDKASLTPSEGTEESGSPPRSIQEEPTSASDPTEEKDAGSMYRKSSDSQNALEDLAHYEFLAQLRRASNSSILDHLTQNGSTVPLYHQNSNHDDLPAAIWSPGAQHRSPEAADGVKSLQACPFCHSSYPRAALRDHIKYCQEQDEGPMVCPLCGYTATLRPQMERHLALHNQLQEKSAITFEQSTETRKFKCLQCGKAFKYKHHLKEHLRIHSGEKPYECSNCKKRFSHSGSYSSHLSSKKCLNSGGGGSTNGPNAFQATFQRSPSAGGGRGANDKPEDNNKQPHHSHTGFPRTGDLGRMWDPQSELALRASILKGTSLLPYLNSGNKFEQVLQKMLNREMKKEEDVDVDAKSEEKKDVYNGGTEKEGSGVSCRFCSQLFPNVAVLLQHERYLCKMNREETENGKPHEITNGLPSSKSPNWHSVPQQLLVAMHSPPQQPQRPSFWSVQNKSSPVHVLNHSPKLSPQSRKNAASFASPPCLDLTNCPPELLSPPKNQNEPLDLSMPKESKNKNGITSRGEKREFQQIRKLSPTRPSFVPLSHHPVYGAPGAPVFTSSMYGAFPVFNQSGLGHEGIAPLPFSQPASSPGFLSPMAYMVDSETEAALKKILKRDKSDGKCKITRSEINKITFIELFAGEMISRGGLDYLSLMDDGFDSEGGPGRKRLKKTDEGLYACDICDKTFQKSSSLLRHKYEHTEGFKHKHHLIEHSRLHSGEKPYQCDKCGKRFSHSGSYSQHMNHRYAYCSKDQQDPDQDPDEMPLTPGTASSFNGRLGESEDTPMSLEETQTPHESFLSDSSLDGATKEEEEEEEEMHRIDEANVQRSPTGKCGEPNDSSEVESNAWDSNEVMDKCELKLEMKESPRIQSWSDLSSNVNA
ncbi:hypothetical protein WMY93_019813 [Mugilogobius chulae]|uniref:C2H2-type domain-containing protein n=1 Tax=Mugilogobius chulae TaxID=88201 RepID=A0AAW0NQL9_9GOBI